MKKKVIVITLIIVVVILMILNSMGIFYNLNEIFPQNPDSSCKVDSDCKLYVHPEWSSCRICDSCKTFDISDKKVIAINKNWKPFCPFGKPGSVCPACMGGVDGADINSVKCINSVCKKLLNDSIE
jgi:hypothetical protein